MNRKSGLNKTLKESSGKEKALYLKVNYNLGCIPALPGIYQERVEISTKNKPQEAVMTFLHTFTLLDSSGMVMKLTSNI